MNRRKLLVVKNNNELEEKVCKFYMQNISNLKIYFGLMDIGLSVEQITRIMDEVLNVEWRYDGNEC
ncbi:MAG: hypothetical protein PHT02_07035 [Tissierellia bacterium]|nr:hypothetical protein [Tissierellia bacterium]